MHDSKLVKALSLLNQQELRRFGEYVHSPYFNKHERIGLLADTLMAAAPEYRPEDVSREELNRRIFGSNEVEYQKLSDLFTYLYRLLEDYLAQRVWDENEAVQQIFLLGQFRAKGMDRPFERLLKKEPSKKMAAEDRLLQEYRVYKEADIYFSSKDSRTKDKSIESKTLALDRFYLAAKLKSCCEMLNRQNIVNEKYRIDFIDEVLQLAEKHGKDESPSPEILIYHCVLLTLLNGDEEAHYHRFIALLDEYTPAMMEDEVRAMFDLAQNYCIKKINTGRTDYLGEIFGLYKRLLVNELIFADGILSQWDYKNIVTVACRLREFDWSENFIRQYKDRLPEADRENAFAYNLASLYYSRQDYGKAMRLLQEVQFTDLYYGLGARSLLLKAYYEAGEIDPLYSLFDSFKTYLRRNELMSEYQYRAHINLVKLTKKLADLKISSISSRRETFKKDLDRLKLRMQLAGEVTNAAWLQEKIAELEPALVKS